MIGTIRIPKNNRHMITIPIEIWNGLNLKEGDLIEIDVRIINHKTI